MSARFFLLSSMLAVLALTLSPAIACAQDWDDLVRQASEWNAIPATWVRAVLQAESAGDLHAVSGAGAMGLMQLMPGTWKEVRRTLNLGADPFDPRDNIVAGATYLRWLHDRYGDVGFLAAYNAGPARYDDHLATGRPLPAETVSYVASVARMIADPSVSVSFPTSLSAPPARDWKMAALFVSRHPETFGIVAGKDPVTPPKSRPFAPGGLFAGQAGKAPSMVVVTTLEQVR